MENHLKNSFGHIPPREVLPPPLCSRCVHSHSGLIVPVLHPSSPACRRSICHIHCSAAAAIREQSRISTHQFKSLIESQQWMSTAQVSRNRIKEYFSAAR